MKSNFAYLSSRFWIQDPSFIMENSRSHTFSHKSCINMPTKGTCLPLKQPLPPLISSNLISISNLTELKDTSVSLRLNIFPKSFHRFFDADSTQIPPFFRCFLAVFDDFSDWTRGFWWFEPGELGGLVLGFQATMMRWLNFQKLEVLGQHAKY